VVSRFATLCVFAMLAIAAQAQQSDRPVDQAPPDPQQPRGESRSTGVRWGAVAYTADGAFGASYGIDTKEDAERLAIDECMRESTDKADCSRGVITRQDSWFFIQFCRRGDDLFTHVTTRRTLAETNEAAVRYAQTSKYGLDSCRLIPNGLFHSGGLHTKI
jgi:uncharacterized protein DUF4189